MACVGARISGVVPVKLFLYNLYQCGETILAKKEIAEVFNKQREVNDGFFGDIIGKCPLCGEPIKKWSYSYGCSGYKNGCAFSVSANICGKQITITYVNQLIESGRTDKIDGFVSPKKGTKFSARLKLENGKAVFDFSD